MMISNNFNVVRLFLAGLVLYSHSFALTGAAEPVIFNRTFGNFAVQCFFTISGYLVTGSFLNSSTVLGFVWRRILRLAPALFVAYYFSLWAAKKWGGFSTNPVPYIANGSIWTLPWEGVMYLGVAFAGVMQMLNATASAAMLGVGLLLFYINIGNSSNANAVIVPFALLFLIGAFIRLHEEKIDLRRYGQVAFILLLLVFAPISSEIIFSNLQKIPFLWGPSTTVLELKYLIYVVMVPFATIFICRYFYYSMPIPVDYSYGFYLFAWPIQRVVVSLAQARGFALTPMSLFLWSGSITLLAGALSWHLIEHPVLRLKNVNFGWLRAQVAVGPHRSAVSSTDLKVPADEKN